MVAVIIPVYNTQATLARCIDSVLAQTMPASEIIIVDDGSPDDAAAIALDYAARYPIIKVVRQENRGLAEARRTGINHATAPLVMHLDSDDTLPPDAVEFLYNKLTANDLDIAYGCFLRMPQGGKPYNIEHAREGEMTASEYIARSLDGGAINSSCCNLSRRSLWTDEVWPDGPERVPSEDILINLRLAFNVKRAGQYNHPTYCYYYNPSSLSIAGTLWQLDRWIQFFTLMENTLIEHGVQQRYQRELHSLKVFMLAFCTHDVNPRHHWVKKVLDTRHDGLTRKTRVLQSLLRHPRLLRFLIHTNRRLKRLIKV